MNPELIRGMAVFATVAKLKSVSKAAAALQMPKSTVSRRVAALEGALGLKLLKRTARKIELTDEGVDYFARCQRIMEAAETAHDEIRGNHLQVSGPVRAAMTPDFALRLVDGLPDFNRAYPRLTLQIELTTRRVDPAAENFDLAVHIGDPPSSGLTAHRLGQVERFLYASPAYLSERKTPTRPEELASHACLLETLHGAEPEWQWTLFRDSVPTRVQIHGALIISSVGLIRMLAVRGAGIALLPEAFCSDDVLAGRLVRVVDGWGTRPVTIYALTASRLLPAKTRAFIAFLKERTRSTRPLGPAPSEPGH